MELSIIIPFTNFDLAVEALSSIRDQRFFGQVEIVCVYNGASPIKVEQTQLLMSILNVKILEGRPWSAGLARNLGAKHAVAETLLFLDSEIALESDFISNGLGLIRSGADLVQFPIFPRGPSSIPRVHYEFDRNLATHGTFSLFSRPRAQLAFDSAAFFISKKLFWMSGGFPDLVRAEDRVFWRRLVPQRPIVSWSARTRAFKLIGESTWSYFGKEVRDIFCWTRSSQSGDEKDARLRLHLAWEGFRTRRRAVASLVDRVLRRRFALFLMALSLAKFVSREFALFFSKIEPNFGHEDSARFLVIGDDFSYLSDARKFKILPLTNGDLESDLLKEFLEQIREVWDSNQGRSS